MTGPNVTDSDAIDKAASPPESHPESGRLSGEAARDDERRGDSSQPGALASIWSDLKESAQRGAAQAGDFWRERLSPSLRRTYARTRRLATNAASSIGLGPIKLSRRRRGALLAAAMAVAGPLLAFGTYLTLSTSNRGALESVWFKLLIFADIAYLLALIGLIGVQIAKLIRARRSRSAGAKLHTRMATVFGGVAAVPTILVAVFFFLIIHLGFQAWFSRQVSEVVQHSRFVARAYVEEHRESMATQTLSLARQLAARASDLIDGARDRRFPLLVAEMTEDAPFANVFVIDRAGKVIARGEFSFLWGYQPPAGDAFERAQSGAVVIGAGEGREVLQALVRLESNAYLFVTRAISPEVLNSLDKTDAGVQLYTRLEQNRGVWLAQFAALYLGFAILVLLAAVYFGLWFAERLARPLSRLSEAAGRVALGDLDARVKEERSDDDLALLSRAFNRMTDEVKRKQEALTQANREAEARRQFTEAVVLGVPAGVVGLDAERRVQVMNRAAGALLSLNPESSLGKRFDLLAPEFKGLLADAEYEPLTGVESQIKLNRDEGERELLARAASQHVDGSKEAVSGFVVTIDDLTDLNSAQRLAAWGDVARRVAHEIKNPLTPIQLSAERLRRKYAARLGEDAENFERYIETIVRQTADIGRMVDAFSRFAKMPTPKLADEDLAQVLGEALLLQQEGRSNIHYDFEVDPSVESWTTHCDRGQLTQAFTNLLTNASDAIQARVKQDQEAGLDPAPGRIRVHLELADNRASIRIEDNGVGLPKQGRRKLLEPYVTTREKGTGLGLAIVSKIVEDHGGSLDLGDAQPFEEGARIGACVRLSLPLKKSSAADPAEKSAGGADAAPRALTTPAQADARTPSEAETKAALLRALSSDDDDEPEGADEEDDGEATPDDRGTGAVGAVS